MEKLIVKTTFKRFIRLNIVLFLGKIIYQLYGAYKKYEATQTGYEFTGARRSNKEIKALENFYSDYLDFYKSEQQECKDIETLSEYYAYKKIEEVKKGPVKVCNVGCFYCGADRQFLKKHPDSTVYGLDFGDIIKINNDIKLPNLKLFPGYPLQTLEQFAKNNEKFDYVMFARVASKININELLSYMDVLQKIAKNIIFLDLAKLTLTPVYSLDINKIDLMSPVKMYTGIYIHNYPALLEKFGYRVVESNILPPTTFDQPFTSDHYFVYAHGEKQAQGQ